MKKVPGQLIPGKKKSPKNHSLLKEWWENSPREVEQFFYFYLSIPPYDSTHTKRCSTLIPHTRNWGKRACGDPFSRNLFRGQDQFSDMRIFFPRIFFPENFYLGAFFQVTFYPGFFPWTFFRGLLFRGPFLRTFRNSPNILNCGKNAFRVLFFGDFLWTYACFRGPFSRIFFQDSTHSGRLASDLTARSFSRVSFDGIKRFTALKYTSYFEFTPAACSARAFHLYRLPKGPGHS